jgi:hypothetical protein
LGLRQIGDVTAKDAAVGHWSALGLRLPGTTPADSVSARLSACRPDHRHNYLSDRTTLAHTTIRDDARTTKWRNAGGSQAVSKNPHLRTLSQASCQWSLLVEAPQDFRPPHKQMYCKLRPWRKKGMPPPGESVRQCLKGRTPPSSTGPLRAAGTAAALGGDETLRRKGIADFASLWTTASRQMEGYPAAGSVAAIPAPPLPNADAIRSRSY